MEQRTNSKIAEPITWYALTPKTAMFQNFRGIHTLREVPHTAPYYYYYYYSPLYTSFKKRMELWNNVIYLW